MSYQTHVAQAYERLREVAHPREGRHDSPVESTGATLEQWLAFAGIGTHEEGPHELVALSYPSCLDTSPNTPIQVGIDAMRRMSRERLAERMQNGKWRPIGERIVGGER